MPGLTPIPVYGPEHIPWQNTLEAAAADIKAEFDAATKLAGDSVRPYPEPGAAAKGEAWQPLADSLNWGAFHLYKQGVANSRLLELFPTTLAVLDTLPLPRIGNAPGEILFSALRAGQHIPPHYGLSNTDMTVHMPITTNRESAIKVCDQTYQWQRGKVFAFDDAFHHESWNKKTIGDRPRLSLITVV